MATTSSRPRSLAEVALRGMPVFGLAADFPDGHVILHHHHPEAQLICAVQGVMLVRSQDGSGPARPAGASSAPGGRRAARPWGHSERGHWIVPPTRALWMPAGRPHEIRCVGEVRLRSVYVRPDVAAALPQRAQAVGISELLRALVLATTEITTPYAEDSRDARLVRLLLDELQALPVLPLHLPQPADAGLRRICRHLQQHPADGSTLQQWATRLGVDATTVQRRFARETGMRFGQWRQQARLLRALERLAVGEKVVDVALAMGYSSPSAFATMFKRQFGTPPSAFFR
jgi:AraC-like DNA-binding protein